MSTYLGGCLFLKVRNRIVNIEFLVLLQVVILYVQLSQLIFKLFAAFYRKHLCFTIGCRSCCLIALLCRLELFLLQLSVGTTEKSVMLS